MIRHIKRNIIKKRFGTNKIKGYWKAFQELKKAREKANEQQRLSTER